jgi:hypothetical protein
LAPLQAWPAAFFAVQVPASQKLPDLQSASSVQGLMQAAVPLQVAAPHSEPGSVRAAYGVQVPRLPATLHASQVPLHAEVQQAPSTHASVAHWTFAVHDCPEPELHRHVPVWQPAPALQSAPVTHAEAHAAPAPLQKVLPHSEAGSSPAGTGEQVPARPATLQAWQVPLQAPSQQTPSTQKPLAQPAARVQASPAAPLARQVPASQNAPALHCPSAVQVVTQAASVPLQVERPHSLPGSVPAVEMVQLPTLPTVLQASQAPPHAPLQQTPSAQKPEVHWLPPPQEAPSTFFAVQVPPAPQKNPALQSASAAQAARQAEALPSHQVLPHSLEGSVRAPSGVQAPEVPERLQASQVPPQAALQQTPSAQLPEAHWFPALQAWPSGPFATQLPEAQ